MASWEAQSLLRLLRRHLRDYAHNLSYATAEVTQEQALVGWAFVRDAAYLI
jgi:hypothetical protein